LIFHNFLTLDHKSEPEQFRKTPKEISSAPQIFLELWNVGYESIKRLATTGYSEFLRLLLADTLRFSALVQVLFYRLYRR